MLLAVLVAFALAATIYVLTLPGVGDATTRVRAVLAAHGGVYEPGKPPVRLGDSVVAVEDEHFYSNFVTDIFDGIGRATLAALQTSQDPGGSTIAQQLARQLYGDQGGVGGTLRQIGLAVKLSVSYSKPQILGLYLNAIYFGHGYWGEAAAARSYFGTTPDRLTWAQASLLAGLPQAPSAYDPLKHLQLAKLRQRHVLNQLVVNHYLTAQQADAAYAAPLGLRR